MIIFRALFLMTFLLAAIGFQQASQAAELGEKYLHGTWVLGDGDCANIADEHVIFRESGAVESVTNGKLTAAGFWDVKGDIIRAHLVASPAFFHDEREDFAPLTQFKDEFHTFRIRIIPFNLEADSFGAVGLLGEQATKGEFSRCK